MVTDLIAALVRRAKQGFGARGRRTAERRVGQRVLHLESLEGRQLLAVAVLDRSWKEFEFSGPAVVSGNLLGSYDGRPVAGRFSGNMTVSGDLRYSSPADAVGEASAVGTATATIYGYGNLPTLNLDGHTDPGGAKEVAGKFSAVLSPSGSIGAASLNGTISTKDFKASGTIAFKLNDTVIGTGTWRGTLAPVNFQPLTVSTTAQWDPVQPGVIDVAVDVGGSVQRVANRNLEVARVNVYWGSATGARLNKLPDTIPLLWNQAGGNYEISKLPAPPAAATKLLFVTTYGSNTSTLALDLPPQPTVSINNVTITPPPTGFGDAVFTVTLSSPPAVPTSIGFTAIDGTAVKIQDYLPLAGVLTFVPGGPLTQTIVIKVKKDTTLANEEFFVQLSNPKRAKIEGTGRGTASIIDIP